MGHPVYTYNPKLADPHFYRSSNIDVLIGAGLFSNSVWIKLSIVVILFSKNIFQLDDCWASVVYNINYLVKKYNNNARMSGDQKFFLYRAGCRLALALCVRAP